MNKALTCDDFTWHETEYTMRQFMENYKYHLPLIIVVTEGFCGITHMHTFSSDELFRIHKFVKQKRVLLRDVKFGVILSTPLSCIGKLHIIHRDGTEEKPDTMENIYPKLLFPDPTKHLRFEEKSLTFLVGDDGMDIMHFENFEIVDEYEEHYLVGNTIMNGELYHIPVVIPAYVSIKVMYATGMLVEKGGHVAWNALVQHLDESSTKLDFKNVEMNIELMLFNPCTLEDGVDKSDYEYLKPFDPYDYAYFKDPTTVVADTSSQEPSPQVPVRQHGGKTSTLNKPRLDAPKRNPPKVVPSVRPLPRAVPTDDGIVEEAITKKIMESEDFYEVLPLQLPIAARKPRNPSDKIQDDRSIVHVTYAPTSPASVPTSVPGREVGRQQAVVMPSAHAQADDGVYGSFADVPMKVDKMSVNEVVSCLDLLKLGKYVDQFKEHLVDGEMLSCMTEDMLKESFKMEAFHARRLYKFASQGYRPRIE